MEPAKETGILQGVVTYSPILTGDGLKVIVVTSVSE
jgi:hypothetical protein